jgi:hypothetical protein
MARRGRPTVEIILSAEERATPLPLQFLRVGRNRRPLTE